MFAKLSAENLSILSGVMHLTYQMYTAFRVPTMPFASIANNLYDTITKHSLLKPICVNASLLKKSWWINQYVTVQTGGITARMELPRKPKLLLQVQARVFRPLAIWRSLRWDRLLSHIRTPRSRRSLIKRSPCTSTAQEQVLCVLKTPIFFGLYNCCDQVHDCRRGSN